MLVENCAQFGACSGDVYLIANNITWAQCAVSMEVIGPITRPAIVHVSRDVVRPRLCSKSEEHQLVRGARTEVGSGLEQVSSEWQS